MPTVQDILARKGSDVISVKPGETVLNAAQLMSERGIGGLVVTKVAEVMTTPVTACSPHHFMFDLR
jgi:CBS domain-containing protein